MYVRATGGSGALQGAPSHRGWRLGGDAAWAPNSCPMGNIRRRGYLPHIESPGRPYMLTYRRHAQRTVDLGRSGPAHLIENTLLCRQRVDYDLFAWCVMPDHVHLVLLPLRGLRLPDILKYIKGYSARRINRSLGRTGSLWQEETYDSIIHSDRQRDEAVEYVVSNPVRAGLCARVDDWRWSSAGYVAQIHRGLYGPWQWP